MPTDDGSGCWWLRSRPSTEEEDADRLSVDGGVTGTDTAYCCWLISGGSGGFSFSLCCCCWVTARQMRRMVPIREHVARRRMAPMAHVRRSFHLAGMSCEKATIIVLLSVVWVMDDGQAGEYSRVGWMVMGQHRERIQVGSFGEYFLNELFPFFILCCYFRTTEQQQQ